MMIGCGKLVPQRDTEVEARELGAKMDIAIKAAYDAGHTQGVRDGACMAAHEVARQLHQNSKRPPITVCTDAEWNYPPIRG